MRNLIFILVLFFSTSVLAESYNCSMTIRPIGLKGIQYYELFIDMGSEEESRVVAQDMDGSYLEYLTSLKSIGKIFFDVGHPYGFSKKEVQVFFTRHNEYKKSGFFFVSGEPSIIELKKYGGNNFDIFIHDTNSNFEPLQFGSCR